MLDNNLWLPILRPLMIVCIIGIVLALYSARSERRRRRSTRHLLSKLKARLLPKHDGHCRVCGKPSERMECKDCKLEAVW